MSGTAALFAQVRPHAFVCSHRAVELRTCISWLAFVRCLTYSSAALADRAGSMQLSAGLRRSHISKVHGQTTSGLSRRFAESWDVFNSFGKSSGNNNALIRHRNSLSENRCV